MTYTVDHEHTAMNLKPVLFTGICTSQSLYICSVNVLVLRRQYRRSCHEGDMADEQTNSGAQLKASKF